MTRKKVVVIGCGNPSRGDDGLGPALLDRLEALGPSLADRCDLALINDFQLQVEHALDLEGRDLALFLDASVACAAPFAFHRLVPIPDFTYTTHALSPAAVLQVYREIHDAEPPPAYVLSVRGQRFDLGAGLGPEAAEHLAAAWGLLRQLLEDPSREAWDELSLAAI
jgi:hydrogenase maturation protease